MADLAARLVRRYDKVDETAAVATVMLRLRDRRRSRATAQAYSVELAAGLEKCWL